MRRLITALFCAGSLMAAPGVAEAKGCIKGAVVGGVAGHYAGHHALLGAAAGCLAGRHLAKQRASDPRFNGTNARTPGETPVRTQDPGHTY